MSIAKIGFGTAQFGMPYGIVNKAGQLTGDEARKILFEAQRKGVDLIDTAMSYGESEVCLGGIGVSNFKVVTKLPSIPVGQTQISQWVNLQLKNSLLRLNLTSIYGLLLHKPGQLSQDYGLELAEVLVDLKKSGIVKKIGVSIYSPYELNNIINNGVIDIVQLPVNILDRRFLKSGWLQRLVDLNIEVHARSIFLQGLLLIPRSSLPGKFERWSPVWDAWEGILAHRNITALEGCLHYAMSLKQVSKLIIGVDSLSQTKDILSVVNRLIDFEPLPDLNFSDENLINPSKWDLL